MRTFPAVLVTGARQTGKTTLLTTEFGESHHYVSLERPDVRARALSDPIGFLEDTGPPLILDEIQHAPELLSYVKDLIDEDRSPGRWLLTGSQTFSLMQGVSQTLAGRVAVLQLDPFSVSEATGGDAAGDMDAVIRRAFGGRARAGAPTEVDFPDWLLRGGYPEPRTDAAVDRKLWFSSYVHTYLERDVRSLVQVADLGAFQRFLYLVGSRTGTILNLSELGREVGIAVPTAKRWLSVLEASQVVFLLRPYHRNFGKRIRKSPKLYLLDPGLATFLLGLHSEDSVLQGPSLGALTETAVVGEWVKAFRQRGEPATLYYWQSASGAEVDLVVEREGALYGLEAKATATPNPRHADGLARWLELAGTDTRGALACRVGRPLALRRGIRAVPWHLAW